MIIFIIRYIPALTATIYREIVKYRGESRTSRPHLPSSIMLVLNQIASFSRATMYLIITWFAVFPPSV